MVSTDYLGRSIVSLVTVRQLSNAFRLSAYLVTLRMTRVLEFPRANNRNGIQTLRIIRVRKLIRTTDSIVYRPPILIPTQISSSRSREKYSDISRMGNRPSIISPIGPLPLQKLSPFLSDDRVSSLEPSPTAGNRNTYSGKRRPFRLDRKLFHRFHSEER